MDNTRKGALTREAEIKLLRIQLAELDAKLKRIEKVRKAMNDE